MFIDIDIDINIDIDIDTDKDIDIMSFGLCRDRSGRVLPVLDPLPRGGTTDHLQTVGGHARVNHRRGRLYL